MNNQTKKPLEQPSEGGSYTRLPDGTLVRNEQLLDTDNASSAAVAENAGAGAQKTEAVASRRTR
jgi:hypothetical protein